MSRIIGKKTHTHTHTHYQYKVLTIISLLWSVMYQKLVYTELARRKTAEQGVERFMAKSIAAEKVRVGLRHAAVCPNVTGRTKGRIAQSKRVRAGSIVIVG